MPTISEIKTEFKQMGYSWEEVEGTGSCRAWLYLELQSVLFSGKFIHRNNLRECWEAAWVSYQEQLNQFQGDEEESCFV